MKTLLTSLLVAALLMGFSSCLVLVDEQHDNGKHRGWYKNPHNPHNPAHGTTQPHGNGGGNSGGNGNGHGKPKK